MLSMAVLRHFQHEIDKVVRIGQQLVEYLHSATFLPFSVQKLWHGCVPAQNRIGAIVLSSL